MAVKKKSEGQLEISKHDNFSGGVDLYLGSRDIKDNESPNAINCDFYGVGSVGNRQGYTEVGSVADSRTIGRGLDTYTSGATYQALKYVSNGSNVAIYFNVGSGWTSYTTTTFTAGYDLNSCQGGAVMYFGNGVDTMVQWNGSALSTTTNGKIGYFPTFYNNRVWVKDTTNPDRIYFSGQNSPDNTAVLNKLGDFSDASAGWIAFKSGAGKNIIGMIPFMNKLYIFLNDAIYRLYPASASNTFTVELVTNAIGCVSARSITQVGEDVFFAGDDGIYSLGMIALYNDVRTLNKSLKVQNVFNALSAVNKSKTVGVYFNFKYHFFYSLFGTKNDSCLVYDTRYQAWQDWRNMGANDATIYTDSTGKRHMYFLESDTGKVQEMYAGSNDSGTAITSTWYSKSFDEGVPDIMKLYIDTTWLFSSLNGDVTLSVIWDDSTVALTVSLSQGKPQGGMGRDVMGRMALGDATNTKTVITADNKPYRMRVKDKKFAVQYAVSSNGNWNLNMISQTFVPFGHYKFPSSNKLN